MGRIQRCADTLSGGSANGIAGWTLDVTPGAAFELKATGPTAAMQDFDIDFYAGYTSCEQGAVLPALVHENVDGDEAGIVPQDATKAVVRLHHGAAATFEYTEEPLVGITPDESGPIVAAVIDTGLATFKKTGSDKHGRSAAVKAHEEFDYCGCGTTKTGEDSNPGDQLVAWWDFSRENPDGERLPASNLPKPGQVWDTRIAHPYDGHGHGTATASLVAGANRNLDKDLAFAPGFELAVAKVGESDGTVSGSLVEALRWAVDTVEADVVSMSIGAIVPLPASIVHEFLEEARRAREKGVLVVVSNGNGFANFSLVPGEPGWATPYGFSTDVLSVGAGGHLPFDGTVQSGYQATSDGEVTAKYRGVGVAGIECATCYTSMSGTSFSAPIVAGMAARIYSERAAENVNPDYVETLLKYSARDTQTPPNYEGYGRLDYHQFFRVALSHAKQGTLPERPSPDINGMYVEQVGGTLRDTWANKLDIPLAYMTPTDVPATSDQRSLGPGAPTGIGEGEAYTFEATAGDTVTIDLDYGPSDWEGFHDFDAFVFSGFDELIPVPSYSAHTEVTRSTNSAAEPERLQFTARQTGTYHLVLLGWTIVDDQPVTIDSSVDLEFLGESQYVHSYGTGIF